MSTLDQLPTEVVSAPLEDLKEHIDKMKSLLDAPEPGLSTWWMFLGEHMKWISDFYKSHS